MSVSVNIPEELYRRASEIAAAERSPLTTFLRPRLKSAC
jgi:hypothetical protein